MKKFLSWIFNVGLSGFIFVLVDKLPWSNIFSGENWNWLIKERFSWLNAVIFIVTLSVVYSVASALLKRFAKPKIDPIVSQLKSINVLVDDKRGVKFTWDVYMGQTYDNDPHATNIQMFCLKHGDLPIRMINGRCCMSGCINAHPSIDEYAIQNYIESILLAKRDELKQGTK